MSALGGRRLLLRPNAAATTTRTYVSAASQYGRSSVYKHLAGLPSICRNAARPLSASSKPSPLGPAQTLLPSPFLPDSLRIPASLAARSFHSSSLRWQIAQPKEDIKDPPREAGADASGASPDEAKSSSTIDGANEQKSEESKQEESEEGKKDEQKEKEKEKEKAAPPPHGDKSPWQVFTETLSSEFKASKEWNEGTKQLQGSYTEFTQNPAMKKMREGYERGTTAASSSTVKVLTGAAKAVGQTGAYAWDTLPVKALRGTVNATGRGVEKISRPLRKTEAWRSARDVIDDGSSSRYGGWSEKEERKRKREMRELAETKETGRVKRTEPVEEDPEAGTNVTLHKDAAWKEQWRTFRDNSPLMNSYFTLKSSYNTSENPLISTARSISDVVAGFFAENETATVIKAFRAMDPTFQLESFLTEMREYILPEVLDAYVKGDVETLKLWLSAAQFQVYSALMQQYTKNGLRSDGRILDIRNVDVLNARMLDPGEVPVFILTARTQEVHVYRNAKSGELAAGMEDKVQQVTYAIGVTRLPEDVNNRETRGWRLIELQKSARNYF